MLAAPTEAVRPVSSTMRRRIRHPTVAGSPSLRRTPATSRNASSEAIGSTRGVTERRIAITVALASRYASGRGARNTPWGQSLRARAVGIAECTPNRRAA